MKKCMLWIAVSLGALCRSARWTKEVTDTKYKNVYIFKRISTNLFDAPIPVLFIAMMKKLITVKHNFFYYHGATAPSEAWPPHSRGF
jgi:hypothetical protein